MRPASQKHRPIGFYLTGGSSLFGISIPTRFDLPIRPEELSRSEPSRLQVVQTLGGAWADSFGAGLRTITLGGHCGWRGGYFIAGEDAFHTLRETVFERWHQQRREKAEAGQDPSQVKLIYTDILNDVSVEVAPKSFTLRRSRSSPLLMRYQIQLIELDNKNKGILDTILSALANPMRFLAGIAGITGVIGTLDSFARLGVSFLGAGKEAIRTVLGIGSSLLDTIANVARELRGSFDGPNALLLEAGRAYARAMRNLFYALAGDPGLADSERIVLVQIGAAWSDAWCTMENSFDKGRYFKSYDDLFGASNCSSTAGGRPISAYVATDQNSLYAFAPADAAPAPVTVTPEAQAAMAELNQGDPLILRDQPTRLFDLAGAIGRGVQVA